MVEWSFLNYVVVGSNPVADTYGILVINRLKAFPVKTLKKSIARYQSLKKPSWFSISQTSI